MGGGVSLSLSLSLSLMAFQIVYIHPCMYPSMHECLRPSMHACVTFFGGAEQNRELFSIIFFKLMFFCHRCLVAPGPLRFALISHRIFDHAMAKYPQILTTKTWGSCLLPLSHGPRQITAAAARSKARPQPGGEGVHEKRRVKSCEFFCFCLFLYFF